MTRLLCYQTSRSPKAFVQRLLAEEGPFAWWEHSAKPGEAGLAQHTLVIADHNPALQPNAQPVVRFTQSSAVLPVTKFLPKSINLQPQHP